MGTPGSSPALINSQAGAWRTEWYSLSAVRFDSGLEQIAGEATLDEPKQHPAKLRPTSSGGLGQPDVALPATTITDVVLAGYPPPAK